MDGPAWQRYSMVTRTPWARAWLGIQADLGRAANTVDAYGRSLEEYLAFSEARRVSLEVATREHVALYVRHLLSRPHGRRPDSATGLSNATIQQRITVARLFHDYLMEEGLREDNPVGRGRYTPGNSFGGHRGLVARHRKLPWIPSDDQWREVLAQMRGERLRNRLMLAFAYDAALRREELCALETGDIDPSRRTLRIRAETTKGRWERVVPYSEPTGKLYQAYLARRRRISRSPGRLFLSESRRNQAQPVKGWTWSKVVESLSRRSGVERFSTHTLRHLCLTDLARAGWEIHEIATFAGHKNPETTLQYIHLSGRDLALKLGETMARIHAWRVAAIAEEPSRQ